MFEQKNSELTVYSAKRGEIFIFYPDFWSEVPPQGSANSRRTDVNIN